MSAGSVGNRTRAPLLVTVLVLAVVAAVLATLLFVDGGDDDVGRAPAATEGAPGDDAEATPRGGSGGTGGAGATEATEPRPETGGDGDAATDDGPVGEITTVACLESSLIAAAQRDGWTGTSHGYACTDDGRYAYLQVDHVDIAGNDTVASMFLEWAGDGYRVVAWPAVPCEAVLPESACAELGLMT